MTQKISARTIEQLRDIAPDELVAHGVIQTAPNFSERTQTGYICPMCGSGNGGNHANGVGDGAGTFDTNNRFFCHACQNEQVGRHKLSPIDLYKIARNLQSENFGEICRHMCAEFGLSCEFEGMDDLPRRSARRPMKKSTVTFEPPPVDTAETDLIRQDLNTSDDELVDFIHYHGGAWRGLPLDILQKHGCKFISNWTSPKSRLEKRFATPTPRVLIPTSERGYLSRLTISVEEFDERARQFIKPKQHAGVKSLFNSDALKADEPVFVVEGYIDALSAEVAGFKAVALGGRNEGRLIVGAVAPMKKKPQLIILLDSDNPGRDAAPKLRDELISAGCACVVRFLADENDIDCNQFLTDRGVDSLRDKLQAIVDDSLAELDAVSNELADAAQVEEDELSSDDLNFLFSGDSSDLDFARRFEHAFGDKVRWLTDDERWITFSDGIWTHGSDTNASVLPLARKLADVMLNHAANDDDFKLASRLKSTAKCSQAITMLKSLDAILVKSTDLDNHSELLNCLNGVVDLTDGKLYPHDSSLLLTQQVNANFDANARSELVEKFFRDIQPDEMTRRGLLRWLGYCLTGEVCEEKILVWFGLGANGKGVLSATILELLGSYGAGLAPTALLKSSRPTDADKSTTALNSLESARFAISEEMPADGELDASLVKNLTGGDKINLRLLRQEYRTVKPTAKINISGNYLPRIENTADDGLLRRLLNMPFSVKFGTAENPADVHLKKKLLLPESLSALLALLVREAVAWYRRDDGGLIISDVMKEETARLLSQSDFVSEFVEDFYVRVPTASTKAKDFLDTLKIHYPRECARFKRADLIRLIERSANVVYCEGRSHERIFKGIGKLINLDSDLDGEPVNLRGVAMP